MSIAQPIASPGPTADALCWIARWHGLSATPEALAAGLQRLGRDLAPSALEEAADRAGLKTRLTPEPLAELPDIVFPVLAFTRAAETVAIERIDREAGTCRLTRFSGGVTVTEPDAPPPDVLAIMLLTPHDSRTMSRAKPGHWLWSAASRFWPDYMQVVAAASLLNLLGLALPLFTMNVYDRVIPNLAFATLWTLVAGVAIAMLFEFLFRAARTAVIDETARRLDVTIAGRLFDQLLSMSIHHRPASSGALVSQIREFDSIRDLVTTGVVTTVIDALFVILFILAMWMIVGPLAIIPAVAIFIIVALTVVIQVPLMRAIEAGQAALARRSGILVETAAALETIKAIGAESAMRMNWNRAVASSSRALSQARYWASVSGHASSAVQQAVSVGLIVYGVFLAVSGAITVGALVAANLLAGRALSPIAGIAQTLTRLMQARAAFRAVDTFMALPPERASAAARSGLRPGTGGFELRRVSFTYPGAASRAFDQVSLNVAPGERIGVLGRVGSGKSTLGRLLCGLYQASEGSVLVDGVDVRQYDPAELRAAVGFCQQEPDLFTGTMLENVIIGRGMATDAAVRRAMELSGLDAGAQGHPLGLAMPITERGRSLSGGQRQAVSLARVLIREPKILFLDEPSAAMDSVTERQLVGRLNDLAADGTTLLIATHRDALLALVDRVLVFDAGRLVMDGPRDEVMAKLRGGAAGPVAVPANAQAPFGGAAPGGPR